MRRMFLAAGIALLAAPLAAQGPAPESYPVRLMNFGFDPGPLRLRAGRSYALALINTSSSAHSFKASDFFARANVAAADRARVVEGEVEVPAHSTVTVTLVAPPAGDYPLKCDHRFHAMMGMRGTIQVR